MALVSSIGEGRPALMRARINIVAIALLVAASAAGAFATFWTGQPAWIAICCGIGLLRMQSPKIASQWERAVVLRLGRYVGLKGPGLFWLVPFVDSIPAWIDQRVITTTFAAEQTLTSDTVPVHAGLPLGAAGVRVHRGLP